MSDVEEHSKASPEAAESPEGEVEASATPAKRPRGRPKGSKNKKTIAQEAAKAAVGTSGEPVTPKKRGRPPKAKPEGEPAPKRPRGRPPKNPRAAEAKPASKGEVSAPEVEVEADATEAASESAAEPAAEASTSEATAAPVDPPKKKRGRPPKSKA